MMVLFYILINLTFINLIDSKFALLYNNNSELLSPILRYIDRNMNLKGFYTKRNIDMNNPIAIQQQLCEIVKSNEQAIVGELNYEMKLILDNFVEYFDIPIITWSPINEFMQISKLKTNKRSCQIFSVLPDLTKPLINYLIDWKWYKFVYVYRSEYSFYRMNRVLEHLSSLETDLVYYDAISVYMPSKQEDMFRNLRILDKRISKNSIRRIVVDIDDRQSLTELLNCLKLLGMLRHEYHYLMVNFQIMELPLGPFKSSGVNVTGFQILDYVDQTRFVTQWTKLADDGKLSIVTFMLDAFRIMSSVFSNDRFRYAKSSNNINYRNINCRNFSYFLRNTREKKVRRQTNSLIPYLKSINTKGSIDQILFDRKTCIRKNMKILLTKFYGEGGSNLIAKTNPDMSWKPMRKDQFGHGNNDRNVNNKSHILRVVTILAKPFVMYKSSSNKTARIGKENFEGFCMDLMEKIFKMINRTYEVHLVKDNAYGAKDANNSWNGMVGELVRGEADIAIAPLTQSSSRAQYITFTEPFMTFGLSLIMKKPVEIKPGFFSFMKPLADSIWISTASACLLVAFGLNIISHISPYELKRTERYNFGNSVWFSFAAVVRQGAELFPKSVGARIVASVWWMFSLVHIAYYTANLAACLSVSNVISPISNIRDLVEKKDLDIKVGTLDSGSTKEFFSHSTLDPYDKVYQMMQKDPSVYMKTIAEGIERVRKEPRKYVFILESKMNEFTNHRYPCDTMMVGSPFGSKTYAVALRTVPRGSTPDLVNIKEQITDAILQLREKQTLAKLQTEWWIKKGECSVQSEKNENRPLALTNLSGVFYILFFGIMLSLVLGIIMFLVDLRRVKKTFRNI